MLFNSIDFAIFLPIVFFLYWFVTNRNLKLQNVFVVTASYVFYSWWDWRFLALILFSTLTDFLVGIFLSKQEDHHKRKILLCISIITNLLFLGFFKYYNFFLDNFVAVFSFFGMKLNPWHLNIVLPVGISFYTFQTMSYSIDVYKRKSEPTRDFIAFAAFVSFFPQLVAGPIERAANLLPQFLNKRAFNYNMAVSGCKQILWGFFKKIVIADNCALYANMIFNDSMNYPGSTLLLGALFFTFQIYGDFSGYSDIATGISKLFGFNLMNNFKYPYFSRDIAEFWRRWHISLTTWFRDYVYIPLGGSRQGIYTTTRNVFIVFTVSGLWHGAKWTFIFWGFLNALYFLPLVLFNKNRIHTNTVAEGKLFPGLKELLSISATFVLTVFAWIFFRSDTIGHAFDYISKIFSNTLFAVPVFQERKRALITVLLIAFFLIMEWIGRADNFAIEKTLSSHHKIFRWGFYYILLLVMTVCYIYTVPQEFIYFQF